MIESANAKINRGKDIVKRIGGDTIAEEFSDGTYDLFSDSDRNGFPVFIQFLKEDSQGSFKPGNEGILSAIVNDVFENEYKNILSFWESNIEKQIEELEQKNKNNNGFFNTSENSLFYSISHYMAQSSFTNVFGSFNNYVLSHEQDISQWINEMKSWVEQHGNKSVKSINVESIKNSGDNLKVLFQQMFELIDQVEKLAEGSLDVVYKNYSKECRHLAEQLSIVFGDIESVVQAYATSDPNYVEENVVKHGDWQNKIDKLIKMLNSVNSQFVFADLINANGDAREATTDFEDAFTDDDLNTWKSVGQVDIYVSSNTFSDSQLKLYDAQPDKYYLISKGNGMGNIKELTGPYSFEEIFGQIKQDKAEVIVLDGSPEYERFQRALGNNFGAQNFPNGEVSIYLEGTPSDDLKPQKDQMFFNLNSGEFESDFKNAAEALKSEYNIQNNSIMGLMQLYQEKDELDSDDISNIYTELSDLEIGMEEVRKVFDKVVSQAEEAINE